MTEGISPEIKRANNGARDEKCREYKRRYYLKHREELLAYQRRYNLEHREERRAHQHRYYLKHREELLAYQREHRKAAKAARGEVR